MYKVEFHKRMYKFNENIKYLCFKFTILLFYIYNNCRFSIKVIAHSFRFYMGMGNLLRVEDFAKSSELFVIR